MVKPAKLSLSVAGHPVGSSVRGVTGVVIGGRGRMLSVLEILSGMFMVTLSRDQVKLSDGAECVGSECAEKSAVE